MVTAAKDRPSNVLFPTSHGLSLGQQNSLQPGQNIQEETVASFDLDVLRLLGNWQVDNGHGTCSSGHDIKIDTSLPMQISDSEIL